MKDEIVIRPATPDDAAAIVEFNQSMALETEGKRLENPILSAGVAAAFEDSQKGFYVVAEARGKAVGGLMVTFEWSDWRNGWFWWIQSVYVRPDWRGRNIYRRLYDFVKDAARRKGGVCGFRLYVESGNEIAQKVYANCGMSRSNYEMFEEMLDSTS